MNRRLVSPLLLLGVLAQASPAAPGEPTSARLSLPTAEQDAVARISLDTLRWSGKPGGVQLANVEGDAMVPDRPYTVALRLGDGVWIQPHWHPKTQHVVVVSGELRLGHGDVLDSSSALFMKSGEVGIIPAEARHYEGGHGTTTVIIYGTGPMTTTFVRPVVPPAKQPVGSSRQR